MSYFQDIQDGIRTTLKGLSLTLQHLRHATQRRTPVGVASENYFEQQNGLVTLQYPHEQLPIPDNGRYRLYNEIDDCIVCDKCAKVCPVDCITIDAVKATEEVGRASDGSPIRLYAAKFDIDMAKCCYCGLCTVVCPTECLTMEKTFDYSEFELGKLTYHFANLTPEQADEKRALYEQFVREKEELKAQKAPAPQPTEAAPAAKRPVFRPTAKPAATPPAETTVPTESEQIASSESAATPPAPKRPVFKPTAKTATSDEQKPVEIAPAVPPEAKAGESTQKPAPPKPAFRPTMKPPATKSVEPGNSEDKELKKPIDKRNSVGSALEHPLTDATPDEAGQIALEARQDAVDRGEVQQSAPDAPKTGAPKPRPAFRPTMKPAAPKPDSTSTDIAKTNEEAAVPESPKPKPAFRPTMKPAQAAKPAETTSDNPTDVPEQPTPEPAKAKPVFRPTMKPTSPKPEASSSDSAKPDGEAVVPELPKPKPAFRPTMKPKPKPDETADNSGETT